MSEMLIAELSEHSFDLFLEHEEGFEASIDKDLFNEGNIAAIIDRYKGISPSISYQLQEMEKKNWNEEWEKNYDPIIVSDQCIVRASFHKTEKKYLYDIIINPKMSFGTGHHETTWLMLKKQMRVEHIGKKVIDIGCGTGILAIMASKLGASKVHACDIDDWSVENSQENFGLNNCEDILCVQGTIKNIPFPGMQDIVLANINRNILLEEMGEYSKLLNPAGSLLLSGFYSRDCDDIEAAAKGYGLIKISQDTKKDWAMMQFQKQH